MNGENCFQWEKCNFEPLENSAHTTELLVVGKDPHPSHVNHCTYLLWPNGHPKPCNEVKSQIPAVPMSEIYMQMGHFTPSFRSKLSGRLSRDLLD